VAVRPKLFEGCSARRPRSTEGGVHEGTLSEYWSGQRRNVPSKSLGDVDDFVGCCLGGRLDFDLFADFIA
jgi:hypothetical protein